MRKEFIKNIIDVDIDGLNGINHYIIRTMYNDIDDDNYAIISFKVIDEFDLTWEEIKEEGGIEEVNKQLNECYGI